VAKASKKQADYEAEFAYIARVMDLPPYERQHRFARERVGRQWRLDFAWPDAKVAVEIDGGLWPKKGENKPGRHLRPKGFQEDCVKLNTAAWMGWLVFRLTPEMLRHEPETWAVLINETIERRRKGRGDGDGQSEAV